MKRKGLPINMIVLMTVVGTVLALTASILPSFSRLYRQTLIRSAETTGRQAVAQVSSTVNEFLSTMESSMGNISAVMDWDEAERGRFFDIFFQIRPNVVAISTYDADGALLACYSPTRDVRRQVEQNLSMDADRLKNGVGYVSAPHVVSLFEGSYPWVVTMVRPIATEGEGRWAALDISCSELSLYINDVGIGQRGYCFLMDEDGSIVYHPQQQLIYSNLKSENTALISALGDGAHTIDNVIYSVQSIRDTGWRVVGVSYVQEALSAGLLELRRSLIPMGLLLASAAFLISFLLNRLLYEPIRGLESAMRQFERDADHFSYQPYHPSGGAREIQSLSQSFGHMVGRIQQLMKQVREEEINLRKTELRALQAQINPHFLYNTLDAITWMCERGKTDDAVMMVNALARLFRISISRGRELIPLRSELQHAECYLRILSIRYRGQFSYRFLTDEDCLDCLCTKIILQPILENAIYHGINGLIDEGVITVSVRSDGDDVVCTVEDNGVGMTAEQIDAVMQKERSDKTGIGIKNVNDRLRIYFGDAYGITIDSAPDEGTRVYIRMPKIYEDSEYEKK